MIRVRTTPVRSVMVVSSVCGACVALAWQGYAERRLPSDLVPHVHNAWALMHAHQWPRLGHLTSLGSYAPPGATYPLLPGVVLFQDPRVWQLPGAVAQFCGAVVGLYLLARLAYGVRVALLACMLFAVSPLGLFTAHSLWPIGHPVFAVWFAYGLARWVTDRRGRWLVVALTSLFVGMHYFLSILPLAFALPFVWARFRTPFRASALLLSLFVAAAIWSPYIAHQLTVSMSDVRSQLLRRSVIDWQASRYAFCDPSLNAATIEGWRLFAPASPDRPARPYRFPRDKLGQLRSIATRPWVAANANFSGAVAHPALGVPLLLLCVSEIAVVLTATRLMVITAMRSKARTVMRAAGVVLVVVALCGNEALLARWLSPDGSLRGSTVLLIRSAQVFLLAVGAILWVGAGAVARWYSTHQSRRGSVGGEPVTCPARVVSVLCLVVPWVALGLLAETNRPERLWFLWPLQCVLLAAAMVRYCDTRQRIKGLVALVCLLAVALTSPALRTRVMSWRFSGYAGSDSGQIDVARWVQHYLSRQGRTEAAIGYDLRFASYETVYHYRSPYYKVGMGMDTVLRSFGVRNSCNCAEGFSPGDEFRTREVSARRGSDSYRWGDRHMTGWQTLASFGNWSILVPTITSEQHR